MKNILILALILCSFASCEKFGDKNWDKKEKDITKISEETTIQIGETFVFQLPEDADGIFYIKDAPLNAQLSQIGVDANERAVYTYQPEATFEGMDQITLANGEEKEECGFGSTDNNWGSCGDKEELSGKYYNIELVINVQEDIIGDN